MATRVELIIMDTMAFWDDYLGVHTFNPNGYTPTNTWVYEVPDEWIVNGQLTSDGQERIFEHLYGKTWRGANDDGSKYVVLECRSRVLPPNDPRPGKAVN